MHHVFYPACSAFFFNAATAALHAENILSVQKAALLLLKWCRLKHENPHAVLFS